MSCDAFQQQLDQALSGLKGVTGIGRYNVIADALSRISLHTSKTTTPYSNAISIDEILCSTIQMSTTGTQCISDETAQVVTLQHLTRTIVDGWPEVYKDYPADLHLFWNFRDELSVENQLLFKGDTTTRDIETSPHGTYGHRKDATSFSLLCILARTYQRCEKH